VIAEGATQGGTNGVIGEFSRRTPISSAGPSSGLGWCRLRGERKRLRGGGAPGQGARRVRLAGGECGEKERKRA
jgi:hypothetical protein